MRQIKLQRGLESVKPYVPGKPIEEVQRELGISNVIKLASNENPIGTSPKALKAMEEALHKVNFYPDGQSFYLSQAIAKKFELDLAQVFVGSGADGVIQALCMAYLDEDCEVIVSMSSFPVYDMFVGIMRAKLIKTPTKSYGLDLEKMTAAISPKTKMIFVCNPNNPTGTIVRKQEVETFLQKVPDHTLVIFDEAYIDFVADHEYPDSLPYVKQGRKNIVVMRTFSKAYGLAGIRIGYGLGDPEVMSPLNLVKGAFAVNLIAQAAGIAALDDDDFLQETVRTNVENRDYLQREFSRLQLRYVPSHTNFILVEIGSNARQVYNELMQKGIIVRPCEGYDLPTFLRITIGDVEQNQRLIRELGEILKRKS